jgi:hypothetical protein
MPRARKKCGGTAVERREKPSLGSANLVFIIILKIFSVVP